MTDKSKPIAVALMSGGLDSTLAAKVILEQGITVIGVNFAGAYCPRPWTGRSNAEKAAAQLSVELVTLPIEADFIAMVEHPKRSRGKNMNPCIDCHTLMIRKAWEWGQAEPEAKGQEPKAKTRRADFIITGEVLGQRPLSQNRQSLGVVARDSEVGDRLLRPLSAKLLDLTEPERTGLVDRERLLDIEGRSRKRQMELAAQYGIKEYPSPAGGCLLTERVFSKRLADAFDHGEDTLGTIELLSMGRHFRLPSGARLVVGRDEAENDELLRRKPAGAVVIDAGDLPGPVGIIVQGSRGHGFEDSSDRILAARICARYSDKRKERMVKVIVSEAEITVQPAGEEETARLLIA